MSREIKTRENYKDIKVLDKSIHGIRRMRQASMRTKESNPQEQMREQESHTQSPVLYAEDKVAYGAERAIQETTCQARKSIKTLQAAKATFDGKVSKSFNIKNIENNHDDIVFEIFDEDGESIYKSKKIAPGYEMNCIELDKELTKGRHECTIEIQYAVEGHVSTVFPIIVEEE